MAAERRDIVKDLGLVHLEQGLDLIFGLNESREKLYTLDCLVLHAVVEKTDLDLAQRSLPPSMTKYRKVNLPAKKTTSNMLWVIDRVGKMAAICLDPEVFGTVAKKCKEAFQPGQGCIPATLPQTLLQTSLQFSDSTCNRVCIFTAPKNGKISLLTPHCISGLALFPFRSRGSTWDNAKIDLVELFSGDIPIPLNTLVADYNPFEWFRDAALKQINTENKAIHGGMLTKLKVIAVNGAETHFYYGCGHCEGMYPYKPGNEACPFCVLYDS